MEESSAQKEVSTRKEVGAGKEGGAEEEDIEEDIDDEIVDTMRGALGVLTKESLNKALELIQQYPHLVCWDVVRDIGKLVSDGLFVKQCMEILVSNCGPFGHIEAMALIRENPHLLTDDLLSQVQDPECMRQLVAMLLLTVPHRPPRYPRTNLLFLSRMP